MSLPVRVPPWSIPACAGEPRLPAGRRRYRPVYPRVCGGTRRDDIGLPHLRGLSPRVRGNPTGRWTLTTRWGSIPACAGEPLSISGYSFSGAVYPRVCGGTTG